MSLTIDDYVRLVLKQGEKVRVASNNFRANVNAHSVGFKSEFLPTADLTSDIGRTKTDVNSAVTTNENAGGTVGVDQPFYWTGATLSGDMSKDVSRTDASGTLSRDRTDPSYSASLNQPLYLFVGNSAWRRWKQSKINFQIAEDNYKRQLQVIRNNARAAYFDVLANRERVKVEEQKLKSSRRSHQITRAMVKAGRFARVE